MAMKIVPRIGMSAPTPAAALSLVRDKNQLSIIGWNTPIPNVMISGQERLKIPRSLTASVMVKSFILLADNLKVCGGLEL